MQELFVRHTTIYRYALPVALGPHRLMLRPRDGHDLRLLRASLKIDPQPNIRYVFDVFSNSVAIATFTGKADTLSIHSELTIQRYPLAEVAVEIEDYARNLPFSYIRREHPDLGRTLEPHYPDRARIVGEWARRWIDNKDLRGGTRAFLENLTRGIRDELRYVERAEQGVQSPVETLHKQSGTCRDFAVLMMEAVRSFGLAARFVSGYLYDPVLDGGQSGIVGAGATHAWVQVYLPGAGWVEFDPTNGSYGGHNLIPVCVAREADQAIPISGSWSGPPDAFRGMEVRVEVRSSVTATLANGCSA